MTLTRREFLGQIGLTLTAWGVGEIALQATAGRYQQALAQSTRRKLALLVGINQYPDQVFDGAPSMGGALKGCLTDVDLQRELLIHRFGFVPSDIVTLTNGQATRKAIEAAFLGHLSDQARSGDVVVVHFSGYGSQVRLMGEAETLSTSLVPVDGWVPTEESPVLNDLGELTLTRLLQTLRTPQVTTVLDVSYTDTGRALQGNLRSRSRPNIPTGQLNPDELELQASLLTRIKALKGDSYNPPAIFPGVVLAAAAKNQLAVEGQWQDLSAGVFTYALTQQVWQATPATTVRVALTRTTETIQQWTGPQQQPQLQGQRQDDKGLPIYDSPLKMPPADGVITAVNMDRRTLQLWLGGIPASVLEYYGVGSRFTVGESRPDTETGLSWVVQMRSRTGLTAKARLADPQAPLPSEGERIYELVRHLPRTLNLVVALDTSLERVERVDATGALSSIPYLSYAAVGEQSADCVLGRVIERDATLTATANAPVSDEGLLPSLAMEDKPSLGSYGLFSPDRQLIPGTVTHTDEAIKTAITRLTPQLQTLLASKLIRMTDNQHSSRLAVRASLETVAEQERLLIQRETVRSHPPLPTSRLASLSPATSRVTQITAGSRIRYRLSNFGTQTVYFTLLLFDGAGRTLALYPSISTAVATDSQAAVDSDDSAIAASGIITVPKLNGDWLVDSPGLWINTYIIFSTRPFSQTYEILQAVEEHTSSNTQRLVVLKRPLEVAHAILSDLHHGSLPDGENSPSSDTYTLDVSAWATLNFVYQVS